MQDGSESSFMTAGLFLCFMNYHATGEGVTSCIAVAGSAQRAERLIKDKLPEYFYPGLITTSINDVTDSEAMRMLEWIPSPVKRTLGAIPLGTGEYYSELHYNLS